MSEDFADSMKLLTEKLNEISSVRSFDREGESEAERLALAIHDIRGSCDELLSRLFPRFLNAESEEEKRDCLQDICMELGHIHYHSLDSEYIKMYVSTYDPNA